MPTTKQQRQIAEKRRRVCRLGSLTVPTLAVATLLATPVLANPELPQILSEHCVGCHGEEGEADVNLEPLVSILRSDSTAAPDIHLLDRVVRVLRLREMPPASEADLPQGARDQLVAVLNTRLSDAVVTSATPSHAPIRRMNRFQYNNAVKDLFQLNRTVFSLPEQVMREYGDYFQPSSRKMPPQVQVGSRPLGKSQMIEPRLAGVAPFPQDLRAENGYDNRGDHLSLSPLLLESFLRLSRSIVESPDFTPKTVGIWDDLFAELPVDADHRQEIRDRLEPFLQRAFRRPPNAEVVNRYADHVMTQIEAGRPFLDAMKEVASAVIASPKFLYLYDQPGESSEVIDSYSLASRLSFFLWGSIPDDELLAAAASGELLQDGVLAAHVDRMLNDRKLKRFCDSFPSQWLQLERIISSVPDRETYPTFYFAKYRSSMHMMLEPLLVFETVLIEDRPVTELIDSDFSYRSRRLDNLSYGADHQGAKPTPTKIPFHRVELTTKREGGVITTAAAMTMTSGPDRTKPITRGAWLATVIFNNPPPPPPADVPPLPEGEGVDESLTIRERLAAHREEQACAGCHEKIDPLGFALENYGPTGRWRNLYHGGRPIDSAGRLFRDHEFQTVEQFKEAILAEPEHFIRAFASHLMSFALARELEPSDRPAIEQIVQRSRQDDFRLRGLIREVMLSQPFRTGAHEPLQKAGDVASATSLDTPLETD